MAIRTRQVKNKRDSNGVLTGRPGTVYDVDIKYTAPDGAKKTYTKRGFATKRDASQHEAEMRTKLQNPGQITRCLRSANSGSAPERTEAVCPVPVIPVPSLP